MAQQLLHDAQVGAALQQVRRGAVPQSVRPDVGRAGYGGHRLMHHGARLPRVQSPAAGPEQQCRTRLAGGQGRASGGQPRRQRVVRRLPIGHGALLVALAEHPQHAPGAVDVVDVQATQFTDPDAGGVEHLDDQAVPQRQRITLLGTGFRGVHGVCRLVGAQHRRQRAAGFGHLQPGRGVVFQQTPALCPRGERLDRRGAPGQRGAGGPGCSLGG